MNKPTDNPKRQAEGAIDMSPEAIDQRLDMVSALYDLGKYLQTAQPVSDPEAESNEKHA